MRTSKKLLTGLCAVLLLGCAAPKQKANWAMSGGSKADGHVILEIAVPAKWGYTETPIEWDVEQANSEADLRCKNWGYSGASLYRQGQFPILKTCYPHGLSPCWSKTYKVQYQCVGP